MKALEKMLIGRGIPPEDLSSEDAKAAAVAILQGSEHPSDVTAAAAKTASRSSLRQSSGLSHSLDASVRRTRRRPPPTLAQYIPSSQPPPPPLDLPRPPSRSGSRGSSREQQQQRPGNITASNATKAKKSGSTKSSRSGGGSGGLVDGVNVFSVLNYDDFAAWAKTQLIERPQQGTAAVTTTITSDETSALVPNSGEKASSLTSANAINPIAPGAVSPASIPAATAPAAAVPAAFRAAALSSSPDNGSTNGWASEEVGDGFGGASGWRNPSEVADELQEAEAWCTKLESERQRQRSREVNAVGIL